MTPRTHADTRSEPSADRGGAPIIGIVLLFGMVLAGAVLVFVAAGPLFDALESQSDRERAIIYMSQTDKALSTATFSDGSQPIEVPPNADMSIVDDGSIEVVWYNASDTDDPPWDGNGGCVAPESASGDLNALEYDLGDRTIIHQGGGIWEHSGGDSRVVSEPTIEYSNGSDDDTGSLRLQIMQLEEGDVGGSELAAMADHSKATALTSEIQAAATECDQTDIAFRIESSYHDAWYDYLEGTLEDGAEVTHNQGSVEVVIEGIRESSEPVSFIVEEDQGLKEPNGKSILPQVIEPSQNFRVGGVIKNVGSTTETQTVSVSIWGDDPEDEYERKNETIEDLGPGETENIGEEAGGGTFIHFAPGEFKHNLTPGETYNYTISTEDDATDEPGSFYYGYKGTQFELSNPDATVAGNVTVSADLHNRGVNDGNEKLTLELEYLDELPDELEDDPYADPIDAGTVERSFGENGTVELPINQSALIDGEYEATILTEDDEETVTFNVTAGVDPGRVGLNDIDNATVDISILSSQVSGLGLNHQLGTMTLEVLTERDGETYTEHVFENPEGGDNINTYPAWQNKSHHVYNTTIEIEGQATLTLASKSYGLPGNTAGCHRQLDPSRYHWYCEDFDASSTDYLVEPVDATADEQEQNLRVRTAADNGLPALQPGNDEQESVDEILADLSDPAIDRDGLWENGELDLKDNEFLFLFETTTECGMPDSGCATDTDDIDALWESAQEASGAGDPNFNDLIVYVKVNRADVNPGTPSIEIIPSSGDETDVGPGDSDKSGMDGSGTVVDNSDVDIGSDHIVIG
ncbi:DUF7289 family protein [Natronorubrum aibiense]|uniref:Type IV pilin n=1 Tax=Natronorubrum aibiense TaxID=348826 RepID=A0A5P9P2T9_9EURY|nr:hypothetical protein [Natronorubrum aibiense]QFU82453.1 hypothetical protein GCU68_07930 [Natronorubrum aibiense]